MSRRVSPGVQWLAFGSLLLSLLLAAFFLVPFSRLWGQMPAGRAAGAERWIPASDQPLLVAVWFAIPSLLPFALFAARRPLPATLTLGSLGLVLLPAVVALATYPCCTSDVLDYVNRVRLWTVYGDNPATAVPDRHPEDWSYVLAAFREFSYGYAYGPLWWFASSAFTLGAQNLTAYLIGLKLLAATCFATSLLLVWQIAEPRQRVASLVFVAWNPIVLVDGLLRLHNDMIIAPWVLAAVWLWKQRLAALSVVSAVLGCLVKVTVAPVVVAIAATLVVARRWRALGIGLALAAATTVVLFVPIWVGLDSASTLVSVSQRAQWSIGNLTSYVLQPILGPVQAPLVARVVLATAGGVLTILIVRRIGPAPDPASLAVKLLLVGMLTAQLSFYSHYLLPVVPLAALASERNVQRLTLAVCFASMVNAVLGVDSLAGGLRGPLLDVLGSLVLGVAIVIALLLGRVARSAMPPWPAQGAPAIRRPS